MISKMYFYGQPYLRQKILSKEDVQLLLKKKEQLILSPSQVFKRNKVLIDHKLRKSHSQLFNYKKLEKMLLKCCYRNLKKFDPSLALKDLGSIEILQFASYERGSFFDWHMDTYSIKNVERIFTIIVMLNDSDDYVGGKLELIDYQNNKIQIKDIEKGEVIIFPSDYLHRVSAVRSGERNTITTWVIGQRLTPMQSFNNA